MNCLPKNIIRAAAFGALGSFTSFAITITTGNLSGVENVLSNNGALIHSGPLIQGDFNPDNGFIVDFVSSGGNLQGSGGQADIVGTGANNPFSNLKFFLENNATFTKADINPDADGRTDGTITFTVEYLDAANAPQTFVSTPLFYDSNGQNRYGISADGSEKIKSVEFNTSVPTTDLKQVRIGGFAAAPTTGGGPGGNPVPDGGATAALLGLSALGLAALCRKI